MIPQVLFFTIMKMQYQVLTSHLGGFYSITLQPAGYIFILLDYEIFFRHFKRLTGNKIGITILSPHRTLTAGPKPTSRW